MHNVFKFTSNESIKESYQRFAKHLRILIIYQNAEEHTIMEKSYYEEDLIEKVLDCCKCL